MLYNGITKTSVTRVKEFPRAYIWEQSRIQVNLPPLKADRLQSVEGAAEPWLEVKLMQQVVPPARSQHCQ